MDRKLCFSLHIILLNTQFIYLSKGDSDWKIFPLYFLCYQNSRSGVLLKQFILFWETRNSFHTRYPFFCFVFLEGLYCFENHNVCRDIYPLGFPSYICDKRERAESYPGTRASWIRARKVNEEKWPQPTVS